MTSAKRSFLRLNIVAFAFTLGAMALMMILFVALAIIPALLALLNLGPVGDFVIRLLRWPLLVLVLGFSLTVLYRHGPSRPLSRVAMGDLGQRLCHNHVAHHVARLHDLS